MTLSDKNIQDFQEIHKKVMGYEISKEEAIHQGMALLTLLKAIYKPMTKTEFDAIQEHRRNTIHKLFTD